MTAYYAFTLAAGQTVSIAGGGPGRGVRQRRLVELQGHERRLGAAPGNGSTVNSAIDNFVAPTDGIYYATVTGTSGSAYSLVVTAGADFGLETNGTFDTAQNISGTGGVLSEVLADPPITDNWYSVNLTAGTEIDLQAYILGVPAGPSLTNASHRRSSSTIRPTHWWQPATSIPAAACNRSARRPRWTAPIAFGFSAPIPRPASIF